MSRLFLHSCSAAAGSWLQFSGAERAHTQTHDGGSNGTPSMARHTAPHPGSRTVPVACVLCPKHAYRISLRPKSHHAPVFRPVARPPPARGVCCVFLSGGDPLVAPPLSPLHPPARPPRLSAPRRTCLAASRARSPRPPRRPLGSSPSQSPPHTPAAVRASTLLAPRCGSPLASLAPCVTQAAAGEPRARAARAHTRAPRAPTVPRLAADARPPSRPPRRRAASALECHDDQHHADAASHQYAITRPSRGHHEAISPRMP